MKNGRDQQRHSTVVSKQDKRKTVEVMNNAKVKVRIEAKMDMGMQIQIPGLKKKVDLYFQLECGLLQIDKWWMRVCL